jgi:hypothetical protein
METKQMAVDALKSPDEKTAVPTPNQDSDLNKTGSKTGMSPEF